MSLETRVDTVEQRINQHGEAIAQLRQHIGDSESGLVSSVLDVKAEMKNVHAQLNRITVVSVAGIALTLGKEGIIHLLKI